MKNFEIIVQGLPVVGDASAVIVVACGAIFSPGIAR
jgi:hypothetical protein